MQQHTFLVKYLFVDFHWLWNRFTVCQLISSNGSYLWWERVTAANPKQMPQMSMLYMPHAYDILKEIVMHKITQYYRVIPDLVAKICCRVRDAKWRKNVHYAISLSRFFPTSEFLGCFFLLKFNKFLLVQFCYPFHARNRSISHFKWQVSVFYQFLCEKIETVDLFFFIWHRARQRIFGKRSGITLYNKWIMWRIMKNGSTKYMGL